MTNKNSKWQQNHMSIKQNPLLFTGGIPILYIFFFCCWLVAWRWPYIGSPGQLNHFIVITLYLQQHDGSIYTPSTLVNTRSLPGPDFGTILQELLSSPYPILSLCKNRYVILKLSKLTNRVVKYEYGCKCGNWRRGAHGHLTTPLSGAKNCNRMWKLFWLIVSKNFWLYLSVCKEEKKFIQI